MAIILFALVQSRTGVCKPVVWIYFEIRFTLTWFWENLKNSTKSLKVALNMKKKHSFSSKDFFSKCDQICSFLRICSHLLKKSLMANFIFCVGCQLLPPWKGWRETWKIYFPVKNGFSVKKFFWTILGPIMMASLNSGCNISECTM